MSAISEQILVKQIINREEQSLSLVLDNYGNLIKSIIRKHLNLLPNYHEECFNDVLLAIWDHIEQYSDEKSSFKNWIAGITRYKAISYARKYIKEITQEDIDTAQNINDERAVNMLLEKEVNESFHAILSGLNEKDKEIFTRLYFEEQEMEQISREMKMSPENIYNRLSRGRKKLRTILHLRGE